MINFATWDELLHQYVDAQGRVQYCAWKAESPHVLKEWLANIKQQDIHAASHPDEQLALWINLYNALTIASILERYPIPSIQPKIFGIPNWIAFLWFFYRPTHKVAGHYYYLNQIEHQILRRDFDRKKGVSSLPFQGESSKNFASFQAPPDDCTANPKSKIQNPKSGDEPRIHFALVCASIGCPLLRNGAYWSESIRDQLEEDAIRFINNPDKVRYHSQTQTLYCSKIFKWYCNDFLKVAPSVLDYIRSYLKTDLPLGSSTPIAYLNYDWSLNQQTGI